MGTVLHLEHATSRIVSRLHRFSPLLDGDGVASSACPTLQAINVLFQSPSRWGRCCICSHGCIAAGSIAVSVPFSMGTVLHRRIELTARPAVRRFQSPSRWGRCCICCDRRITAASESCFSPLLDGDGVASRAACATPAEVCWFQSPSRWGRCCICQQARGCSESALRFSPLLDGDGVASDVSSAATP